MPSHTLYITSLFCALTLGSLTSATHAEIVILYDADVSEDTTQTPPDQGWEASRTDVFNPVPFFVAGDGHTYFDTNYDPDVAAGFSTHSAFDGSQIHPDAPDLDPEEGFTLHYRIAIANEDHEEIDLNNDGKIDNCGFNIVVLCNDKHGISLNYFDETIWAADDDQAATENLFTQAESTEPVPGLDQFHDYSLTLYKTAYRLEIDGRKILQGRRRNYENSPSVDIFGLDYDPWDKPNTIGLADGSFNASSQIKISDIRVETGIELDTAMKPKVSLSGDLIQVTWDTLPGRQYQIQTSRDLKTWTDTPPFDAQLFQSQATLPAEDAPQLYVRVLLVAN